MTDYTKMTVDELEIAMGHEATYSGAVEELARRAREADALRAENEMLCVHGAEPTDEEWKLLREALEKARDSESAMAQESDAMRAERDEARSALKSLLCDGHDAGDYAGGPGNQSCVICDLKAAGVDKRNLQAALAKSEAEVARLTKELNDIYAAEPAPDLVTEKTRRSRDRKLAEHHARLAEVERRVASLSDSLVAQVERNEELARELHQQSERLAALEQREVKP